MKPPWHFSTCMSFESSRFAKRCWNSWMSCELFLSPWIDRFLRASAVKRISRRCKGSTYVHGVAHSSTHRYRHNCLRIDPYQRLRVNPHTCVTCRIGGFDPKVAHFVHLARRRECRGGQSLAGNPFLRQGKGLGLIVCRLIVNLFAARSTAGMVAPQLSNFPTPSPQVDAKCCHASMWSRARKF